MAKSNKRSISKFELVWYILCGLVIVWGLAYIGLGLAAEFANVRPEDNVMLKASNVIKSTFGLGFRDWGLIILAIGVVACVFVLCICAKTTDREQEKSLRRSARISASKEASK